MNVQILPNGLKVIVLPREELDLLSVQLWLKVGSAMDGDKPGLLHLLEHMLFNGSAKYPPGAVDEKIEELGGKITGETGQDFTYIAIDIRPDFLYQAMDIISDIVQHPTFDEKELEREKKIVIAEIKGASNPFQLSAWYLYQLMFKQHPYRNPIPGDEQTVNSITKDDLLAAWRTYYHPASASLVVVGRVSEEKVFQLARQFFGNWENTSPQPIPFYSEEPLNEIRNTFNTYKPYSLHTSDRGVRTYIALGFPAPSIEQKKGVIAFELLNQLIEDGKLFKRLREENYVSEISSFFLTQKYPSIFIIYASTWADVVESVRNAVLNELTQLTTAIDEGTFLKGKNSLLFSFFRNCETYSDQAHILGFYDSIADYSLACDYPRMVEEITLAEVKAVWEQFIRNDAYCFVSLIPQK